MLYVTNQSTVVSDDDVALMTRACAHQLRYHAEPVWGRRAVPVVFVPKSAVPAAAPGSVVIAVLDDSDQADALGWHTEDSGDVEYGRVFAKPVLDNGGDALTAQLSVASVLSHEVLEWFVDPHCNLYAGRGDGTAVAVEVGDPVESDSYPVNVKRADGTVVPVTLSNFVTPAWFDPQASAGERLDWMGRCTAAFEMTSGGYTIVMAEGQVSQKFGDDYPEWRKPAKLADTSRTARRVPAAAA